MIIESSAPTRVDLAGGTIDIWPLYLFHPGAATVNFATSLRARVRIETNDDGRIVLESRDRKVAFETTLAAIEDLVREERVAICYTGDPRLSGTNNWDIFKRHIDGDPKLFQLFDGIRDSALRVRDALLANDWDSMVRTMRRAYPNRKRLAPGVTTPQM